MTKPAGIQSKKKTRGGFDSPSFSLRASGPSAPPGLPQLRAAGRGFCARLPPAPRRQCTGQDQHPRSGLSHGHIAFVSRRRRRPDNPAWREGIFRRRQRRGQDDHEIKMYWSARERNLALDGQPVKKLANYLGALRTVVFCTEDLQLIKGTARARRRFLDLLLAQTQPGYLPLLQRYMRAVRARNALLKHSRQGGTDEATLDSFSRELVELGNQLIRMRAELAPKFSPLARLAYRRISNDAEELRIEYQPSVKKDFAVELAQSRNRERTYRSTLVGPHRDDLQLLLNEKSAAQFGSEGQKRTLAIALKMAQAEYLTGIHGSAPVLLIDDVMGELDVKRRSGFLPLLEQARKTSGQVFMTATEESWPSELGRDLQRWEVQAGMLQKK